MGFHAQLKSFNEEFATGWERSQTWAVGIRTQLTPKIIGRHKSRGSPKNSLINQSRLYLTCSCASDWNNDDKSYRTLNCHISTLFDLSAIIGSRLLRASRPNRRDSSFLSRAREIRSVGWHR